MKKSKLFTAGVLALVLALGLVLAGCGGDDGGGGDTAVTFSSVTANGSSSQTTTSLTLTFSQAITGLAAGDITLSGVSGVSKGTFSGSGPTYTLGISGFTSGGTLNVAVSKSGYNISGSPKSATIYYSSGSGGGGTPSTPQPFNNITASQLVANIKIGWNLGNTLEAAHMTWLPANPTVTEMETGWSNPVTTKAMITAIKNAGFNTIRLPVTWTKAAGGAPNYTIRSDWMARVVEVVNYAVDNNMYIILNTHHDEEDVFTFMNSNAAAGKAAFQKIWEQIADTFKNYDEKLIFEALNEPRTKGSANEWSGGTAEERSNLNAYYQIFVDTVRPSGGNNDKRILQVNTYAASIEQAAIDALVLPNDTAANKLIVSVHAYQPYNFCYAPAGSSTASWSASNPSDVAGVTAPIDRVYNKFVSNGIPVIIGEFYAMNKNNENARAAWAEYYVDYAWNKGIKCVLFDNGIFSGDGEQFGFYNRTANSFPFPLILTALMNGAGTPDIGGGNTAVTFSSVTADGSSSQTTTSLTLTFSQAITGLSAGDITLSGVAGVSKGTLSGSNPYTLNISGFTSGGTLSVAVSKSGYNISGSPKSATIYYSSGGGGDGDGDGGGNTAVTFISVTANGHYNTSTDASTTTTLTLTFDQTIPGLTADDFTLQWGVTDIDDILIKGELSGSGPVYTLSISGLTSRGWARILISFSKSGYYTLDSSPWKSVEIYYSDNTRTFISLTANGSSTQTTSQLTLTFDRAVPGLTASDITLSGASVTRGSLSGTGPTYTLGISGVSSNGTLNVAVARSGYTITGSPKTVSIYYYYSPPPPPSAPDRPNLSVSRSGNNLTLTWSFPSSGGRPDSILVRVQNPDSGQVATVETLTGTATSYTFNYGMWLDSSGVVRVQIVGQNSSGNGSAGVIYTPSTNTSVPF